MNSKSYNNWVHRFSGTHKFNSQYIPSFVSFVGLRLSNFTFPSLLLPTLVIIKLNDTWSFPYHRAFCCIDAHVKGIAWT